MRGKKSQLSFEMHILLFSKYIFHQSGPVLELLVEKLRQCGEGDT